MSLNGNTPDLSKECAMAGKVGRPLKYVNLLSALEDGVVYSPASIAHFGEANGLIPTNLPKDKLIQQRVRIRHTLARYKTNHEFPKQGDGFVYLEGQSPTPGWYGSRWKAKLENEH